jgi:hypothetical protein
MKAEKRELEATLSEAEAALEKEETKVRCASLKLSQVKQVIERKINSIITNLGKAIKESQTGPESELETKSEAPHMGTKPDADSINFGGASEHTNTKN